MTILIVTDNPADWPASLESVQVVSAKEYLGDLAFSSMRNAKVFNLCRSYRYQNVGYYVSLLAEARGHKPLPSVTTLQDLKSRAIIRLVSDDLQELIERSLDPIKSDTFTLSIYFGRNTAKRYDRLALHLFNQFQTPLLRVQFVRSDGGWQLRRVAAIGANEVPQSHWPFIMEAAAKHFAGRRQSVPKRSRTVYDLAILHDPKDPEPPSDAKALRRFIKAAAALGISAELIERDDYGRLAEFDGLFIRETTAVDHHTYRFARRAESEGLVVIDDPTSIVRCTNKVYLAELLTRHKVPIPKTLVLHRDPAVSSGNGDSGNGDSGNGDSGNGDSGNSDSGNGDSASDAPPHVATGAGHKGRDSAKRRQQVGLEAATRQISENLGYPCVLKKPDSSFSQGVVKVKNEEECNSRLSEFFESSALVVAQEFLPTTFDWRIGILDRQPLYACKYYMAQGHWQIIRQDRQGRGRYGKLETLPVEVAPRRAVQIALKAANLIGDGFYGVDVKQSGGQFYVIEVNDNPNLDSGCEDAILKDELYRRIMSVFLRRIEQRKSLYSR